MDRVFVRHLLIPVVFALIIVATAACGAADPIPAKSEMQPTDSPSTTPTPAPTATSLPIPTPTDLPTSTTDPTETPEPTETPVPTNEPTLEPTQISTDFQDLDGQEYEGGMGYINELVDMETIETELVKPQYTNTWPLPLDQAKDYSLIGVLTNHQRVSIELPDGHVVELVSEFFYKDSEGVVQKVAVPLFMQNGDTGYSFRSVRAVVADKAMWDIAAIETGLVKNWWHLDDINTIIPNADINFKRASDPRWRDRTITIGGGQVSVSADFYLTPVLDGLGVSVDEVNEYANTGNIELLPLVNDLPFLVPTVIFAPTLDS